MPGRGAIVLLALLALVVYGSLLAGGFSFLASWDDAVNIVENPMVSSGSLEIWRTAWQARVLGVYEPLGLILKGTIVRSFGLEIRAFQLVTLGLHILNSSLLFVLTRRLLARCERELGVGLRPELGGLLAALFFALHPMRVEVVAWASGQSYALAGSFFLLSLLAYLTYRERSSDQADWRALDPMLVLSIVAYAAAVLSKSSAIFLPAVLLLLDFFPLRRKLTAGLLAEKAPYLLLGLGLGWAALQANAEGQATAALHVDLPTRLAYAMYSMIFHLGKTLWPATLHPHYAILEHEATPFTGSMLLHTASFVALCVGAFVARRRAPWLTVAWFAYVAGMLPVSGIVGHGQWTLGADRYTYLPLLGLWIMAGGVLTGSRLVPDPSPGSSRTRWVAAILALLLLVWSVSTRRQVERWRSDEVLWSSALAMDPGNALALGNLGYLEFQRQRFDEAIPLLARALVFEPWNLRAGLNLGISYQKVGRHLEAVRVYERALEHHADEAALHNNLGVAHAQLGNRGKAREHMARARKLEETGQSP